jgi:hypothetical protein
LRLLFRVAGSPEQLKCEYAAHSIDIVFPRWVADDAPRILARRLLSMRPTKVTSGGCRLFRHLSNHAFAVDPRNVLRECLRRRRYFPSLAAAHTHTVPSLWQWLADIFILSLRLPHTEDIAHTLSLGNLPTARLTGLSVHAPTLVSPMA